ncbi:hypothetical protein [Parvimonas micra]|uniref:hypothetical protein n=1 Tax=Parvimonas micra TaxID=33033 RepID=UPI0028DBCB8C|nr:hypothetical protein [Parvimonas micra]
MVKLKITTISPLILSPRTEKALYKGVDFKNIKEDIKNSNIENVDKINIIYPFYSYEERDLLPGNEFSYAQEYYIPASSLKGALLSGIKNEDDNSFRTKILFQDIKISKENIELKNLYKFQYLYQNDKKKNKNNKEKTVYKAPKFESFFPSLAIEMIGGGKKFETEVLFRCEVSVDFKNKLEDSFESTKNKLNNYMEEVEKRITNIESWIKERKVENQEEKSKDNENYLEKLKKIKYNIQKLLQQIQNKKNIVFLGGYKGILGSLSQLDQNHNVQNGFYIDKETMLPYGLLEVNVE